MVKVNSWKFFLISIITSVFVLSGCGSENENMYNNSVETDGLKVTTSFSILADMVEQVLGDRGNVEYVVSIGQSPEEYEPRPSDFQNVTDADVFYVNGLGLEQWLERVVSNASDTPIVELSKGVDPIPLEGESGVDPHAWLSPKMVITYVENIIEDLIKRDPEGETEYRDRGEAYIHELEELDEWIKTQVETVDEEQRVIIVSENAFKYFGADYKFVTEGIWELNSHDEGTTGQINRVIDIIRAEGIKAIFVETTVDKRYMETVSDNTGIPIAGEVYTDAVGAEGSGAETYIKMIRHNVATFVDGLAN